MRRADVNMCLAGRGDGKTNLRLVEELNWDSDCASHFVYVIAQLLCMLLIIVKGAFY